MDLLKRIIGIILIAAVVTALVLLVVGFVRSRSNNKTAEIKTESNSRIDTPSVSSTSNVEPEAMPQTGSNQKTFVSNGNTFGFPNNWGVLTCNNSANFELDPNNSQDSQISCDIALKPITVLVNSNAACKGTATTISNITVSKYRMENARGIDYQWCFTRNGASYNITHRVSQFGVRGTSKEDFSAAIEQMIANVK